MAKDKRKNIPGSQLVAFEVEGGAGPSRSRSHSPRSQSGNGSDHSQDDLKEDDSGAELAGTEEGSEQDSDDDDEHEDELGQGMNPEGFAGPAKPLTPEALAAFRATQERAGVIYISRIPPGMRPTKVRHLMSQYGEVGRVYLQQEGAEGVDIRLVFSFLLILIDLFRSFF